MKRKHLFLLLLTVLLIAWLAQTPAISTSTRILEPGTAVMAPEFPDRNAGAWINSEPLTLKQLRGKVVLIDFWTFGCWNCYRSFPWLNDLEARYQDKGLQVIGIHTPEFDHEKKRPSVVTKAKGFGLHHPIMMDNDFRYWRAMKNRYWPAYYLLDKKGRIRATFVGETHVGDRRARAVEATIKQLLAE